MTPIFRSPAALMDAWRRFGDEIARDGYTAAPTDTAFCRHYAQAHGCPVAAVERALARYAPPVQDAIDRLRADIITEGALAGEYPATVSTFVLKNQCGWADKPERTAPAADIAAIAAQIEKVMNDETA